MSITLSRVGWRDQENASEGLKRKEEFKLAREDAADAPSKLLLSTSTADADADADADTDASSVSVFVRRRHFPILPVASAKLAAAVAAAADVVSVVVLDEPTPKLEHLRRKAHVDSQEGGGSVQSQYDIPAGGEVRGDIVFFAKSGFEAPLAVFKKTSSKLDGNKVSTSSLFAFNPDDASPQRNKTLQRKAPPFGSHLEEANVELLPDLVPSSRRPIRGKPTTLRRRIADDPELVLL